MLIESHRSPFDALLRFSPWLFLSPFFTLFFTLDYCHCFAAATLFAMLFITPRHGLRHAATPLMAAICHDAADVRCFLFACYAMVDAYAAFAHYFSLILPSDYYAAFFRRLIIAAADFHFIIFAAISCHYYAFFEPYINGDTAVTITPFVTTLLRCLMMPLRY